MANEAIEAAMAERRRKIAEAEATPEPTAEQRDDKRLVYEVLRTFPYHTWFLAEYHGETRRCQKMEHVNIGSGWMLQVEGVKGTVSDSEITNPRPLGERELGVPLPPPAA